MELFVRICAIFLMISVGCLARKRGCLDDASTRRLAFFSTNFVYPAAIYSSLVGNFTLSGIIRQWTLPAGTLLIMGTGFAVGWVLLLIIRLKNPAEARMFHFQSTVNNYVFMPLPLIMAAYGDSGVGLLSISTAGSEIAVWTLGVIAISGGVKLNQLRNMLNMPMAAIAASIVTLAMKEWIPWSVPADSLWRELGKSLLGAAGTFGAATVGLSMTVAGSRMMELHRGSLLKGLQLCLVPVRLILVPACCLCLIRLLPFPEDARRILYIISVMPSSIASVALSDIFHADTETASASVLLTHAFSLVTIPIWLGFL